MENYILLGMVIGVVVYALWVVRMELTQIREILKDKEK